MREVYEIHEETATIIAASPIVFVRC